MTCAVLPFVHHQIKELDEAGSTVSNEYLAISELLIDLLKEMEAAEETAATGDDSDHGFAGDESVERSQADADEATAAAEILKETLSPQKSQPDNSSAQAQPKTPHDSNGQQAPDSAATVTVDTPSTPALLNMSLSDLVGRVSAQKKVLEDLYLRHQAQRRSEEKRRMAASRTSTGTGQDVLFGDLLTKSLISASAADFSLSDGDETA